MNRKGELSNRVATIVAIDYDTIFSKKPSLKDFFTKSKLQRTFKQEYKDLTLKLYSAGFSIYIISKDLKKTKSELDDLYFGRYIFYTDFIQYENLNDLAVDCRSLFKYFICETPKGAFLDNVYSLESFKELL